MKIEYIGLLITLLLGIFIIIGSLIAFITKKKQKVIDFSLGLATSVIIMLIVFDIIPEIIENLSLKYIWVFIIGIIIGYAILKLLDNFIPDHEDNKMTSKELKENLTHIGIVSAIALSMHNIIEGMAVYQTTINSVSNGLMLSLGIGFHNLPLGMVIATTFYQSNQKTKKIIPILLLTFISTLVGGLIMFAISSYITKALLGALLSITLGMLIFIAYDELLPRIKIAKYKKERNIGLLIGIVVMLLSLII